MAPNQKKLYKNKAIKVYDVIMYFWWYLCRTQEEMLSKIAELNHSSSHLKDMNASMMLWLDAAESEIVTLNSDNKTLRIKVNM